MIKYFTEINGRKRLIQIQPEIGDKVKRLTGKETYTEPYYVTRCMHSDGLYPAQNAAGETVIADMKREWWELVVTKPTSPQ